ncbi:unnamed protein product [Symbiodinium natans]|uniref:Copia protein n=1 Tax=Symbiodinium natans TaxID=878477 RepID=A0A812K923_9DINO|nr:unnamed protein product [Symbiodinium natans]
MLEPMVPVAPAPSPSPPPPVVTEGPVDEAASDPESSASASSDKMTTDSERRPESHEDRKRERTEREEGAPGEARALGSAMETGGKDAPTESVPEPKGEKRLQAPPFYAGSESPSKRVRVVKVGDAEYYVGDEDLDDWWNMVEFDARYFEKDDWMDYSPENDPEKLWEGQDENEGPPVLGPEQLEEVEAVSRSDELHRLLEMSVLEAMDEAVHVPKEKLLKTRHTCTEYMSFDAARASAYVCVSTPGYVLRSFDVKDLARCDLKSNVACPVVYGGEKLGATIHVDDGLLGGCEDRVNSAVSVLQQKYRLEVSPVVKNIGTSDFDLTMKDESDYLDKAHVGRYRAALGCLLYISPERPDVQHCVGVLARGMSKPTVKQLNLLSRGLPTVEA